jgi:hypothetical protein
MTQRRSSLGRVIVSHPRFSSDHSRSFPCLRDRLHIEFGEEVYKAQWFLLDRLHSRERGNGEEEQIKGAKGTGSSETEGEERWQWRLMGTKFCTK